MGGRAYIGYWLRQVDRYAGRLIELAEDIANSGYDDLASRLMQEADNLREIAADIRSELR